MLSLKSRQCLMKPIRSRKPYQDSIYLIIAIFQLLDVDPEGAEEEGAVVDLDSQRKGKCAVIKTSTRQVSFPFACKRTVCVVVL